MASKYDTILTNTQTAVMALAGFADLASAVRARPFCSVDHGDTLPFVCFSGSKERERELYFGGALVEYPVYVTIFRELGPAIENATARLWKYERRDEVRTALWQPQAVHSTQVDADYDPEPAWDFGGLDQQFDVSVQLFTFTANETR